MKAGGLRQGSGDGYRKWGTGLTKAQGGPAGLSDRWGALADSGGRAGISKKRRWKSAWIRGTINWDQKLRRNSNQWRVIAVL